MEGLARRGCRSPQWAGGEGLPCPRVVFSEAGCLEPFFSPGGSAQAGYPPRFWTPGSDCWCSSLPSEQRLKTALGDHGEQARQRERGEDPLQHEAQRAGESLGRSETPDSLQTSDSSTGETGAVASPRGVLQEVCAWIAGRWKSFQGFG